MLDCYKKNIFHKKRFVPYYEVVILGSLKNIK